MEDSLVKVRNAGTEQDLGIQYKALKPEVDKLNIMAAKRQQVIHLLNRRVGVKLCEPRRLVDLIDLGGYMNWC